MSIDTRCLVSCNLGSIISGNINDDYIQGNGLILVRGSIVIAGLITPVMGAEVTFPYTKNGVTRSLPRKLRVLSSFADPFRRITKVQLGCKLTYLNDKREQINWTALDDPANSGYTEADQERVTVPIAAQSIANKCLQELGIQASSSPLTNYFSVPTFDFSGGYVNILSNLLISECFCGYLDLNETLQIVNLNQEGGTGIVVTPDDIIDISSISTGALPGEAVTVRYSSLRLIQAGAEPSWTVNETSDSSKIYIPYTLNGDNLTATFNTLDKTKTTTYYRTIKQRSNKNQLRVVDRRITVETRQLASVAGSLVTQYLSNGIPINGALDVQFTTTETFFYDDEGNETERRTVRRGPVLTAYGTVGLPTVFTTDNGVQTVPINVVTTYLIEELRVQTYVNGDYRKVTTRRYGPWMNTLSGQQAISESRDSFTSVAQVMTFVEQAVFGRFLIDVNVATERSRSDLQQAPLPANAVNQANAASSGNPSNNWRTESKSELTLAYGSPTAQRITEFSLPYAPDDFFRSSGGNTYTSYLSNAEIKARNYGRIQNRLLLAHRAGMAIQLSTLHMPEAPFSSLVVQANGLSGLYRTNGTNWTFNNEGIVVGTDALFWGAIGGTGDFWFPVAPGVSSLPTTPATGTSTINGLDTSGNPAAFGTVSTMAVAKVVKPFNESVTNVAAVFVRAVVTAYNYPLNASTSLTLRTRALVYAQVFAPVEIILRTRALIVAQAFSGVQRISGTAAPLLGAGQVTPSSATAGGWSLIFDDTDDEGKVEAATMPFSVTVDGTGYTSVWVTSNAYLTFPDAAVVYQSLSASQPSVRKLHIGADDFSYQRVYIKSGGGAFRIRWEGNSSYSAGAGNSNRFFEVSFYEPLASGTQYIEVRSGNTAGGTSGPFMLCNNTTALASGSFAANQSWVYEGNASGTTWTLYTGEHVEG